MSDDFKPFGVAPEVLEQARQIASDAIEVWGDLDEHQMAIFRERGLWNDHVAVQAVLAALSPPLRDELAELAKDNRKRCAALGVSFKAAQRDLDAKGE